MPGQLLGMYLIVTTAGLSVACVLTVFLPGLLPVIPSLTTYGKAAAREMTPFVRLFQVPKRWFTHFYVLAVITTSASLTYVAMVAKDWYRVTPSERAWLSSLANAEPHVTFTSAILALSLLMFHVTRRCVESLFVSVYSDTRMNVMHYATGIIHYAIVPLAIVCETEGVAKSGKLSTDLLSLRWTQYAAIVTFLTLNYLQHNVAEYFAALRYGPTGHIITYGHAIPFGGLFKYVSCPHFLYEVGIYVSLWFVLGAGATFKLVVFFVCINQMFAALITHKWYRERFGDKYPKDRKAIIPFVL